MSYQDNIRNALLGHLFPIAASGLPAPVATSASTLTAALTGTPWKNDCEFVMLQCDDELVRYTFDGSAPTATQGFQLKDGDVLLIPRHLAEVMQVISAGAGPALLWVEQYRSSSAA